MNHEKINTINQESTAMLKDVYYYKNANKALKSKLREVVAVNHRLAQSIKESQLSEIPNPAE